MKIIEILADMLGGNTAQQLRANLTTTTELRLRIGKPALIRLLNGGFISGDIVNRSVFENLMNSLMENSLYARERELRQGYFTSYGGCRVGICGHVCAGEAGIQSISAIASACIRIPREICGCAAVLKDLVLQEQLQSLLLISPPGMGKTTMLRDLVRQISDSGFQVALADERREIAACNEGVPQLDVGQFTDVMDGLDKTLAIPMMIRACAPDLIAVDELGGAGDARAVLEAHRCGVAVAASVHAASLQEAVLRPVTAELLRCGVFQHCAVLGPVPGKIKSLHSCAADKLDIERNKNAEDIVAGDHTFELYGCGQSGECAAQAQVRAVE